MSEDFAVDSDLEKVGFGTSGVRGLVDDLTDAVCYAYTSAFLTHCQGPEGAVCLGHDLRPSSPRIAAACASAIRNAGKRVIFCGALPTPALAYYALQQGLSAVMITGSHIPFDRNGIKFYSREGEISKADEAGIRRHLTQLPAGWRGHLDSAPLPPASPEAMTSYARRYLDAFAPDALAGWRIGVYQHSSVARDLLMDLIAALGGTPVALGRSDSFVPVDTEALDPELEEKAQGWCTANGLDAIVSTDGDADRPLIGDEQGRFFRGDAAGILTARHLGAQVIVTPVSSNTASEKCGAFEQVVRTRIGSPYVIDAMRALPQTQRIFGFEANGGVLTQSPFAVGGATLAPLPTRDAVLPILSLLTMARGSGVPLSSLRASLPRRFTASGRLAELSPERLGALNAAIATADQLSSLLPQVPVATIDRTDGTRVTLADGRIVHLRPSGNAPEMRCYAEAEEEAAAQALVEATLAAMLTLRCP